MGLLRKNDEHIVKIDSKNIFETFSDIIQKIIDIFLICVIFFHKYQKNERKNTNKGPPQVISSHVRT